MSMKLEKRKLLMIGVVVVGLALLGIGLWSIFSNKGGDNKKSNKGGYDAANNAQRVTFLENFGWDVSDEPIEVCEIILPENFDEVYKRYNELQKTQGLNLEKFKGRRAKRWTYQVLNYPSDDEVHANVIVCDNKIIAGDICSVALGGFIHGFSADEIGAFSEQGLLASDLPTELNGIERRDPILSGQEESEEPQDNDNQGNIGEAEGEEIKDNIDNKENAENKDIADNKDTAELIDDIEQQTKAELENALEMLIQAAEDKQG